MTHFSALCDVAAQAARQFGDRPCMSNAGRHWTFRTFQAEVDAIATRLAERWPAGSRVGLFMANRAEYLLLQCALERASLVRVPLNARFTRHEVGVVVEDCAPVAVFHDASTEDRASNLSSAFPEVWWGSVDEADVWRPFLEPGKPIMSSPRPEDLCSINYTSGTSGRPKGVMLTHRNWSALTRNMLIDRDMQSSDIVAHIGPLTHASGTYFLPWFLRGAHQVVVNGSSVDALLQAIEQERVTVFTCVPTVLTRLVNHPRIDAFDLSSLRSICYGAEPIPLNTLEKATRRFGSILTQNYGLTEAMMTVATLRPGDHFVRGPAGEIGELRYGCIGRPYTFVEVVLRDEGGRPVPAGEVGELTVRSEHMTPGYWNRPEETDRLLREGWLYTGDLARFDEDGFLYLSGRSKDMLISGGFNIYPAELEAVLSSHPVVMESGVVGIPDPDWGEIAVAFVAFAPDAQVAHDELEAFCKPLLGIRTPRRFLSMRALPKNVNGKIDKIQLRELAVKEFGVGRAGE